MKNFFKSNIFKFIVIIAVAGTVLISYSASVKTSLMASAVGYITEPIQNFFASHINAQSNDESIYTEDEISELRNKTVDYYELKTENEQMKKILGIKEEHEDYKLVQADVIGRDSAELFYGVTINKGTNSGVKLYSSVITDKGVVGYVSAVYSTYSKVSTILSPQTNIGAYDTTCSDTGVICGDADTIQSGQVSFKYINNQNNIKKDDIIATSGVGGVYPKNLLIGKVSNIIQSNNSYDVTACIEPYEDIKNIRKIYVITEFDGMKAKTLKE